MSGSKEQLAVLEAIAQRAAQMVGPSFDAVGLGFAVLGFSFGPDGWITYASNAKREEMVRTLREMADKLERGLDVPPPGPGAPEA